MRGRLITVEGGEGVGKSTHLGYIRDWLAAHRVPVLLTREPGGTPRAERIRTLLLEAEGEALPPESELLLMFAARALHVAHVIRPALKSGTWVVCDRFVDASYAYQGGGRGVSASRIAYLERWLLKGLKPDLTLLLDAPVAVGLQRMNGRGPLDRFEREQASFFERVRRAYRSRARREPRRIARVDAGGSRESVQAQIAALLETRLRRWV